MSDQVTLEQMPDGIAIIRLARTQARNAMTLDMVRYFRATLEEASSDPSCRIIILTGADGCFCAGLDLKAAILGEDAPEGAIPFMELQELFAGCIAQIRKLSQPVIAAIDGAAVGFGFGLALAADIRILTPRSKFLIGAVKVGLSAGECGISYHLPRLIGAGRAFDIMLTGRPVGADEALAIGLATRMALPEDLLDEALSTARAIAENSPYAVKHTKQVMWSNLEAPSLEAAVELENHVQVVALLTGDFREAATAFAERRPPEFKGR